MSEEESARREIAVEAAKVFDLPAREVAGFDEPVVILTEQERHDLGMKIMALEHRLVALGDRRRLQQIMDASREGSPWGRIAVDMTADAIGIDAAARDIVEVLALRLAQCADRRQQANAKVLTTALRNLKRDAKSMH